MEATSEKIDEILLKHGFDASSVIAALQEIQHETGYLPMWALLHLSKRLGISLARLQALSTFYRSFSLKPQGKHMS